MSGKNGAPQDPNLDIVIPARAARFGEVAGLLRDGNPARGFARAAEILLENFETLTKQIQPYAILKLAIETHKHALFCEVAQDKARTQHDAAAFAAYQAYLAGETDVPVAMGLPNMAGPTAAGLTPNIDEELEAEDAEGQ
jgi:hypothetical protein